MSTSTAPSPAPAAGRGGGTSGVGLPPVRVEAAGGVRWALRRQDPAAEPSGPPVLLLHGRSTDAACWTALQRELGGDRTVIAPDLPGFGGSESTVPATLRDAADRLAALVLHEVDGAVDLVGADVGGTLGLALARQRPELVRRLVLVGASYPRGRSRRRRLLERPSYGRDAVVAFLLARGPDRAWASLARQSLGEGPTGIDVERTLVVWGARDRTKPLRVGEDVVRALGPATILVALPGVDHHPHLEAPDQVAKAVGDLLRAGDVPGILAPAVGPSDA